MIKMTVNKTTGWMAVCVLAMVVAISCSPAKNGVGKIPVTSATATAQKTTGDMCSRTVRYYIEKVYITNADGIENEVSAAGTFTVDPVGRKITNTRTEGKRENTEELNLVHCNLSNDMQNGEAFYEVVESVEQENGNTDIRRTNLKVEPVNGAVNLSVTARHKPGGIKMTATRWEVVN